MNRDHTSKAMYTNKNCNRSAMDSREVLDNDTEFNANRFKLYDDFATDLRFNFTALRTFHEAVRSDGCRRRGDPDDSGVDVDNGNPLDTTSNDSDLVSWSPLD